MPDAIQVLIGDLLESTISSNQQPIVLPTADFIAALNEIETAIGGGIVPSTIVLTNTHILVGNASNVGSDVALSGDATITNTGVLTIGASAITTGKIAAAAVTTAKIANANVTLALIQNATANSKLLGSGAAGGGASYSEISLGSGLSMSGTTLTATGTGGTVTSVGLTGDGTIFNSTVTGSPVTTSGNLVPVLLNQTANFVLVGPSSGPAGAPTFRALVASDIPAGTVVPASVSVNNHKIIKGNSSNQGAAVDDLTDIILVLDGGGVAIASGARFNTWVDFACTITQVTELADVSGSVALDIQTCSFANYAPGTHPVAADSITGAAPPSISTASKYQDATLTGWTPAIAAGTCISLTATGAATSITRVTCALKVTKS